MSSLTGITFKEQTPEATVAGCVQAVKFSLDELPHVLIKNVQQTPKPSAQDPELDPPLLEHS